jgi:hypothetical protein
MSEDKIVDREWSDRIVVVRWKFRERWARDSRKRFTSEHWNESFTNKKFPMNDKRLTALPTEGSRSELFGRTLAWSKK